jgi:hypothetical protein
LYIEFFTKPGNDTIDPYPLFPREARKILIVKNNIFKELAKRYQVFCRNTIGHPVKTPTKSARVKIEPLKSKARHWSAYEPSGKEYINDYNWRRWVRVKEWFQEFGPNAQQPEKNILIQ